MLKKGKILAIFLSILLLSHLNSNYIINAWSDSNNISWTNPRNITNNTTTDSHPSIIQTKNGWLWVFYTDYSDIYYLISYDNGITWNSSNYPITNNPLYNMNPSAIQSSNGNIWVVWTADDGDWSNSEIYYTYSSNYGNTWKTPIQLTNNSYGDFLASISQTSDGRIWITWHCLGEIYYTYTFNNGNSWVPFINLTNDPTQNEQNPYIYQTLNGDIWCVFENWTDREVYYKKSSNGGTTWSSSIKFTSSSKDDSCPTITQHSNGDIFVFWSNGNDIWEDYDLYYKRSQNNGLSWSSSIRLTLDSKGSMHPSVIQSKNNKLNLVWTSSKDADMDIFYMVATFKESLSGSEIKRQRMLDIINYNYDFYDRYLLNCNDCDPGTDPKKTNIKDVDTELVTMNEKDIWMIGYPYYLNFGTNLGIDTNTWYNPSSNSPQLELEITDFIESIAPFIDEDTLNMIQKFFFTAGIDGYYLRSPIYWDEGEERAEIALVLPVSIMAGGQNIDASARGTWYYDASENQIMRGPFESAVGTANFNLNLLQKKGSFNLYIKELDYNIELNYELSVAPMAIISIGLDTPNDISIGLDALWVELLLDPNLKATATSNIHYPCLNLYDINLTVIPKGEFSFEAIMPFKDYRPGEFIETELKGRKYYSLQKFCPEGVVSLSDIEFTLRVQAKADICLLGTHTIDLVLGPYTWETGFEYLWGPNLGIPHSPIDIHIYDSKGRHAGPNGIGGLDNEIPNCLVKEEDGEYYVQIFSSVDEFTMEVEGKDVGEYGLELQWPLLLHDNAGKTIITPIEWKLTEVTTFLGDKDFFYFDFRYIQEMVQNKIDLGKSIDESISEVLESLDADNDGIPDVHDNSMIYNKKFPSLFVKDKQSSAGELISLEASLFNQEQPLAAKAITFYLNGEFLGNTLTDLDGIARLPIVLPDNLTKGIHEIKAVFFEDLTYFGCIGTGMLNCVPSTPQVTLISPDNSTTLKGTVEIDGIITDSNLIDIELFIDGEKISNQLPYSWNTTIYPDGPHVLILRAIDATNLQEETSMLVIVDNTLPVISNVTANSSGINAIIEWETNELCDSTVFYTRDFKNWIEVNQEESTTQHKVIIRNLIPGTYYLRVHSRDWANNETQDNNKGGYYQFTIAGMSGDQRPTYLEYGPLAQKNIKDAQYQREEALSLLEEAKKKKLDISQAQAIIEKADGLLADSKKLYLSKNYIASNNLALEAINLYQKAIRILLDLIM